MQSFRSRIWTRVAVSVSFDDNHYTTGTSEINIKCLFTFRELSLSIFSMKYLLTYFLYFYVRKQLFFKKKLVRSASLYLVLNLADPVKISTICFLYPLCVGLFLKSQWITFFLFFPSELFTLKYFCWISVLVLSTWNYL